MHTGTSLDYIREKYRELGKPVPQMLELLSEVYGQVNGKTITGEELYELLLGLCSSYECYCALNTPENEWDEYDQTILPIWKRLAKMMEVK